MSDLISRITAMENYCNALCPKLQKGEYCNNCIVKAWLNNQPTAYDMDNVVDQLEAYSNKDEAERLGTMPVVEIADAIKIVKGGGVNAKTDS